MYHFKHFFRKKFRSDFGHGGQHLCETSYSMVGFLIFISTVLIIILSISFMWVYKYQIVFPHIE